MKLRKVLLPIVLVTITGPGLLGPGGDGSWNSSHGTRGCSPTALAMTHGVVMFYCLASMSVLEKTAQLSQLCRDHVARLSASPALGLLILIVGKFSC